MRRINAVVSVNMVCLVWFHVAALLLLLHTSTQTDVELKNPEDVKKQISLNREWIDEMVEMFSTSVSDIQFLRDTILKADPKGMKNIDESIQDLRGSYEKLFPDVHFKLSKLVKYFKENAARSKNVMSQYSIEKCNTLIPHRTADVILMDENIDMKFEIGKEFDIYFFNEDFLSQILGVMSNVETK